jgi:hypothetical protein
MRKDLDEALCRDFPLLFRDRHADMETTAMCWGFDCASGWEPIIREAAAKIESILRAWYDEDPDEVLSRATQVKEKFGRLMIYMDFTNDEISGIIDAAETKSIVTCEVCGKPGEQRDKGWTYTLCDEHDQCPIDEMLELLR